MALRDSIDKIVSSYFQNITEEDFEYKNRVYALRRLFVSRNLPRDFTCPEMCGGCCPRFSLDYLPHEKHPYELTPRIIEINGIKREIFSDLQNDHRDHFCRNLDKQNGRCTIHGKHPFSCDFEIVRFKTHRDYGWVGTQLYSRGWNFLRVDGARGARCEIIPGTRYDEVLRKMKRLQM